MDASQIPKGQSPEVSFTNRPANQPGVYRHSQAGVELITQPGSEGRIQADALVRLGYQRVGDVPTREELLAAQKRQLAKDMAEEKAAKIREDAELAKLEADILAEAQADADALKAQTPEVAPAPAEVAAPAPSESAPSEPVAKTPAPEAAPAAEVAPVEAAAAEPAISEVQNNG